MLGESCKASGWKGEGRRGRGSLIVEINIGAQQQSREIRIGDVHDLAKTDQQIRCFMAAHNLKEGAFSYLRTLIQQQAALQPPARRNCSPHCKCATKMQVFEEKERRLSEMMSGKNSPSRQSFSRSPDRVGKREPQHLEIKLTTHDPTIPVRSRREESAESFVFNSSFTLPSSIGERDRVFMTDELFENAFGEGKDESSSNLSEFQSAGEHVQINKVKANPIRMKLKPKENKGRAKESEEKGRMKENELVMSSPTFRKPNPKETTPQKTKIKLTLHNEETQNRQTSGRKTKMLSTRERKEAIMTPKKPALTPKKMKESAETSKANLLILNAENLEHMVSQHKRSLQEMSTRLSKQALQQPLFNQKCLPGQFQEVLVGLFRKLTQNNPPHMKELHSQYVSYQQLAREELHFMGVLFEKIDHKELNNLDYDNFRSNSLKYCWAELEAMAHRNDRQEFLYF